MAGEFGVHGALILVAVGIFSLGGVCGLRWEVVPDDYVYACAGNKVTLPWNFKVMKDESVLSVTWIYENELSSTLVGTMIHEHFVVATFAYSGRVKHVGNGGLTLDDLSAEDSGNYTVEVKVTSGNLYRSFQNTVYLQVEGGLMLKGGQLTAAQDPAWWDESSRQWFIRLTCGPFSFLGHPHIDVTWTFPGGQTHPSSGYDAGYFYLTLATPVQGGIYTCTIPPSRLPQLCYRNNGGQDNPVALTASNVTMNELKARMSMLEVNQKTLRENNARMQERVRTLEQNHQQELQNETNLCQNKLHDLQSQLDEVEGEHLALQERVQAMYNKTMYVDMTGPCKPGSHKTIDDSWRSTKEGEKPLHCDKSLDPGWYRFYLRGENAVIPTECVPVRHCQTHAPTWLNLQGKTLPAVGQQVEGRACSHWSSDCCNWESSITVRNCGPFFVYKLRSLSNCQLAYCVEPQHG